MNFQTHSYRLADQLQKIDFNVLPISDYNKKYIANLKPALRYYFEIYAACLADGIKNLGEPASDIVMVDFGGGSGFMSMLAKEVGIKQVIYVDMNPESVHTISVLKNETGMGPDVILEGSTGVLKKWCDENRVTPQLLAATDLIEHIYDLNSFFGELTALNNNMYMVFTTGANPYNPHVKKKLRNAMQACETGTMKIPNYFTLRYQFIENEYPGLSSDQISRWTAQTRGLVYADIRKAIDTNAFPELNDAYNTCDPATGNWMERILPIHAYQSILKPLGYRAVVKKGFYNANRENPLLSFVSKCMNLLVSITGKAGFYAAPIIMIHVSPIK